MNSNDLLRHELIKKYMNLHAEKTVGSMIVLWERMATEIVSLVGEGGFNSLFERCISLTQIKFPWLILSSSSWQSTYQFAELRLRFEEQMVVQSHAANNQLLIAFTDLLASLIGEQITVVILHTAMDSKKAHDSSPKELEK
ncbi:hypothetical protein QN372_02890 [Undibacterium sp. RTI2.1]|uniref:hypothetical protein n=1 Tax=unclassified Undibacterium TaxID=2630295 RepID=UPI002B2307F0|nr:MULTISPECIES: hypothetical protein [unclassified Undibacterium]MEB0029685.1 hypothetical protein [Undibacterium sp. RTI2.1]MEB0116156.1 hypothetical protein [Undibacterium sp. RTI2.2]